MSGKEPHLLVKEAAELLGCSPNTIRNWGREGKLPEYRHPLNNYRLYRRSDLLKLRRRLERPELVGGRQAKKKKRKG